MYTISRANYERMVAQLSDRQFAYFDANFNLVKLADIEDDMPPEGGYYIQVHPNTRAITVLLDDPIGGAAVPLKIVD